MIERSARGFVSLSTELLRGRLCETPAVGSEVEQELDDRWWLGLVGRAVKSIDIAEFNVVATFGSRSALTIESEANIEDSARHHRTPAVRINDDGRVSVSNALLSLEGQRVLSGVAFKTGTLRLVFDSGVLLIVPFVEKHEAWQLTGPSGRLWVSLPGGGLATFPPARA